MMKKARPSIGFERTEYTLKKGAKVEIMKIRGSSADADSHSIFSICQRPNTLPASSGIRLCKIIPGRNLDDDLDCDELLKEIE